MEKLISLFMIFMLIFTLAACGGKEPAGDPSETKAQEGDTLSQEQTEDVDLSELESALEVLEALKPEGWDENNYGAYIYDVYDSSALPECFPEQPEGTLAYETSIKDYSHDVLNQNYEVGPIWYDSYEDYRAYSVSFYANVEHLEQFLSALEAKGMHGQMDGQEEAFGSGSWWEGFYAGNGWAMYLFYNTNDIHNDEFDGCLTARATEDIYELPPSIAGIPLPQVGVIPSDPEYYTIQDFSNGYEDKDFDLANDSLPAEYYAAWMDYYGVTRQDAMDYVSLLEEQGWVIEYTYTDEADSYCIVLSKEGVYAIADYEEGYMAVGFSDMIENLTY